MTAPERSWLVLTDGYLQDRHAKTAHGVLRYARDPVAAVLDRDHAGARLTDVLPEAGRDFPIVASIAEAQPYGPTSLLLGVATPGGWIPEHWRDSTIEAIRGGMEIVNGLHNFLRDDPELVSLAHDHGARLWDVREPPPGIPLSAGRALEVPARIVATVGSDCAVGKMTVALELVESARSAGRSAEFVPTGQTGIMIAGWGIAIDRVISDFTAGAAEKLILDAPTAEVLVVEGQGSLWHPSYSGVTLGLVHGSAPEAMVFCHQAGRRAIEEPPYTALPSPAEMIATYEDMASVVRPAKVACVALNCKGLDPDAARRAVEELEDETGLVCGDVLAGDAARLWKAVAETLYE